MCFMMSDKMCAMMCPICDLVHYYWVGVIISLNNLFVAIGGRPNISLGADPSTVDLLWNNSR